MYQLNNTQINMVGGAKTFNDDSLSSLLKYTANLKSPDGNNYQLGNFHLTTLTKRINELLADNFTLNSLVCFNTTSGDLRAFGRGSRKALTLCDNNAKRGSNTPSCNGYIKD